MIDPNPETSFPFLFLGAGVCTAPKCLECQVWFHSSPTPQERVEIEQLLPRALKHYVNWTDDVLHFGSDDALEPTIRACYRANLAQLEVEDAFERLTAEAEEAGDWSERGRPTRDEWEAFCREVESRMVAVDRVCPIRVFVKPYGSAYGSEPSTWHDWTLAQLASRFHESDLVGSKLSHAHGPIAFYIARMLAKRPEIVASANRPARDALVTWIVRVASAVERQDADRLIDAALPLIPAGEAVPPELVAEMLRHPTRELLKRIGPQPLVETCLSRLDHATPESATTLLDELHDALAILDGEGAKTVAEALLQNVAMAPAVSARSRVVREGFERGSPTGKGSPSLALCARAYRLIHEGRPDLAVEVLRLALRFPYPEWMTSGWLVFALFRHGEAAQADELATSDVVQKQAGPANPEVFRYVARFYVEAGRAESAIQQLRCYTTRRPTKAASLAFSFDFEPLRHLPEFRELCRLPSTFDWNSPLLK